MTHRSAARTTSPEGPRDDDAARSPGRARPSEVSAHRGSNSGCEQDGATAASSSANGQQGQKAQHGNSPLRVATYNASLNRGAEGQLLRDLSTPDNEQAQNIAEVIQINAPDVVLVNEFDHVPGGRAAEAFRDNYLSVSQNGKAPQDYPYY